MQQKNLISYGVKNFSSPDINQKATAKSVVHVHLFAVAFFRKVKHYNECCRP